MLHSGKKISAGSGKEGKMKKVRNVLLKGGKGDSSSALTGSGAFDTSASSPAPSAERQQDSILGNTAEERDGFALQLSNFGKDVASSLRGTLKRKKDKNGVSLVNTWKEEDEANSGRSTLPPPMPPIAPTPKLRRVNSSTMSLGRNKKKLLTLEELYVEILYTILHMIGCDAEREEQKDLILHLKEAFHMTEEKHLQLLDIASMREEPYLKANLEIVGARDLLGKDMSGSSDPFCTFYLTTNPLTRLNTSYKPKTLSPQWNEDFVLDVNSIEHDSLRIDVWDFNPEENVSDKFRKIGEIKDGRGLRRFIKETLNASAGKSSHELIGSVEVPLRDVPSAGMDRWLPLEKPEAKKSKCRKRGDVHVKLVLSTEKDQNLTSQEHKHLLKILFAHELQKTQEQPFSWNGSFSKESVTILGQHAVQGKLTGAETALARWLVYAHTHCDLPLDYRVFHPILEKLHFAVQNNYLHQEDETKFIETAGIFTHHCVEFIKKHRHFIGSDTSLLVQLEYILRCLQLVSSTIEGRDTPSNMDSLYDISEHRQMVSITSVGHVKQQVEDAVAESMEHWYRYIVETLPVDSSRALRVKNIVNLVQLVISDLMQGCRVGQSLFKVILDVDYLKIAFEVYQKEITDVSRELVESTCEKLKPIIFCEDSENDYVNDTLTIGTTLFELYLSLQQMAGIGKELYGDDTSPICDFMDNYNWFNKAVARWLDIALYKAMQRIIKAVELDSLEPVDVLVKHSSSAVDIRTVLLQIKTFWKQLSWPDVEASYAFISKILDDVCKTSIFYADHMCRRVVAAQQQQQQHSDNNKPNSSSKFQVTPQLCLAINNIDYVLMFIKPFVTELGMEDTLDKLEALDGETVAASCRRTLTTLVQNALENVENKILEVLDMVGEKMAPVIQKFLIEGSSLVSYAARDKETLLQYLDNNMIVLKDELNETNFERILSVIWESSAQSLADTINLSIDRQKPPSYFKTLLDILNVLISFFYGDKLPQDETLLKMKSLLQLYAADSQELISRYLWERHREQKVLKEFPLGSVTVRCQMLKEHLRVEVLNARHLKPPDPMSVRLQNGFLSTSRRRRRLSSSNLYNSSRNLEWVKSKFKSLRSNLHEASIQLHTTANAGQCDPYVTLRLVPEHKFAGGVGVKFRTRSQRRTLFPLFDETFDFVLGSRNCSSSQLRDCYLLITVKDRGLAGRGIFLGEALVPLGDMSATDMDRCLTDLPQVQLPLTRPTDQDSDLMLALDSRNFDRIAMEFLAKEKKKL